MKPHFFSLNRLVMSGNFCSIILRLLEWIFMLSFRCSL